MFDEHIHFMWEKTRLSKPQLIILKTFCVLHKIVNMSDSDSDWLPGEGDDDDDATYFSEW